MWYANDRRRGRGLRDLRELLLDGGIRIYAMNAQELLYEARRYCRMAYYRSRAAGYLTGHFICGLRSERCGKLQHGEYGFCFQLSDSFIGIRYRSKTHDNGRYGLIGISVDHGWYDGAISYGVVWRGRWHGLFIKY